MNSLLAELGRLKSLSLIAMLLMTAHGALGQTSVTSIPEADENGEIHICLGSTVLFNDDTPDNSLSGETIFNWDFGNGDTATTAGPHSAVYDSLGTFEVSLSIITLDGSDDLGEATFTVVVDGEAPFIPTLGLETPVQFPTRRRLRLFSKPKTVMPVVVQLHQCWSGSGNYGHRFVPIRYRFNDLVGRSRNIANRRYSALYRAEWAFSHSRFIVDHI